MIGSFKNPATEDVFNGRNTSQARRTYQRINEIINGRREMTPSTALRLERFLGMSSSFWMDLQLRWELYQAHQQEEKELQAIEPHAATGSH